MHKGLTWLEELPRFSKVNYNLFRTWLLLQRLLPEYKEFDLYFITGSKGKGTVAATLAAILNAAGISTGLVTSPHLVSPTERLRCNGVDISEEELADCLQQVAANLPDLPARYGSWIYSEVILAAAFLWFHARGARTVVLEAGLGGRLDPGNLFRRPRGTCISTVMLEHRGVLGNTLAEIAREKAGIIKPRIPIVTGARGIPLQVIAKRAESLAAPLYLYDRDFAWEEKNGFRGLRLPGKTLQLFPCFATDADKVNKAMAACLAVLHPQVTEAAIAEGISTGGLPGRFEVISGTPVFVLDVAHTPESIDNFIAGIKRKYPGRSLAFVAGFLEDKPVEVMLAKMEAAGKVFYAPVEDYRGYNPQAILFAGGVRTPSISTALSLAAAEAEVVGVTGSFAAVREARGLLSKRD